jgi:hypothetical protein
VSILKLLICISMKLHYDTTQQLIPLRSSFQSFGKLGFHVRFFLKKDNLGNFWQEKCQRNDQRRVGKKIKQGACSNSLSVLTKGVQNIRAWTSQRILKTRS